MTKPATCLCLVYTDAFGKVHLETPASMDAVVRFCKEHNLSRSHYALIEGEVLMRPQPVKRFAERYVDNEDAPEEDLDPETGLPIAEVEKMIDTELKRTPRGRNA